MSLYDMLTASEQPTPGATTYPQTSRASMDAQYAAVADQHEIDTGVRPYVHLRPVELTDDDCDDAEYGETVRRRSQTDDACREVE